MADRNPLRVFVVYIVVVLGVIVSMRHFSDDVKGR